MPHVCMWTPQRINAIQNEQPCYSGQALLYSACTSDWSQAAPDVYVVATACQVDIAIFGQLLAKPSASDRHTCIRL